MRGDRLRRAATIADALNPSTPDPHVGGGSIRFYLTPLMWRRGADWVPPLLDILECADLDIEDAEISQHGVDDSQILDFGDITIYVPAHGPRVVSNPTIDVRAIVREKQEK